MDSKKAHYFVRERSICNKWMFLGTLDEDDGKRTSNDCAECVRKLDVRIKEGKVKPWD